MSNPLSNPPSKLPNVVSPGAKRVGDASNACGPSKRLPGERALMKEDRYLSDVCEASPIVLNDRLLLMECIRPGSGGSRKDYYILIKDVETGREMARLAAGYGLASAWVHDDEVYVYASRWQGGTWNDVTLFRSGDLRRWRRRRVIKQDPPEHIFNTSVCEEADGKFVMAYETDDPAYVPFTVKFAQSRDLLRWQKIPGAICGPDRYTACPCLRYFDGRYYMLYLEHMKPQWRFETYMVRSRDLVNWEPSPRNPILAPGEDEDINTSDPDIAEYRGRVYLYYSIGDQRTYSKLKRAVFDGTLADFLMWCYRTA